MNTDSSKMLEIVAPEPFTIRTAGVDILIKEIEWTNFLRFLELLSAKTADILRFNSDGSLQFDITKIPEVIRASAELVNFLIASATSIDPTTSKHSPRVMLAVIDKALEMNVTEEHIKAGKSVADRFLAAVPVTAKAVRSVSSSSSSDTTATPGPKSNAIPGASSSGGPSA